MSSVTNIELIPTRLGFAQGVMQAAERNERIILIGSDVTASLGLADFPRRFPRQFVSLGIAEQNAASVAAGLALEGFRPIFASYATFATTRALDQIRVSICYTSAPVLIGGAHAGISVGPDGATHQALEDMATMRVLPGMTVVSPCDANQTAAATLHLLTAPMEGPAYIRFGREAVPNFTDPEGAFSLSSAVALTEGAHLTIVATGHLVWHALQAARSLARVGVEVRVINVSTIKPLAPSLAPMLREAQHPILTVEEHQAAGGLGAAVAESLAGVAHAPLQMLGVRDAFGQSGAPSELMRRYHLTEDDIHRAALALLREAPS